METKKYYIRETAFGYNDEYAYVERGFGDIKFSFDNLEAATKELKRLTHNALKGIIPDDFEPISYCHKDNNEEAVNLDAYIQTHFGRSFLIPSDYREGLMPDRNFHFPHDLTEEQAWEIRKISGIRQFELIEVADDGTSFWGIQLRNTSSTASGWMERPAGRYNNETGEHTTMPIPVYFNSEEDAKNGLNGYYIMKSVGNGLKGTYEELSDTPDLLKSMVEGNNNIRYDEVMEEIKGTYISKEDILMLNGLLKNKLFRIAPFPMDEIQALGTGWYAEV